MGAEGSGKVEASLMTARVGGLEVGWLVDWAGSWVGWAGGWVGGCAAGWVGSRLA